MPTGVLEKYEELTETQKEYVTNLILLFDESNKGKDHKKRNKVQYGVFKGGLKYIADDFDNIPEGFEEYL